MLIATALILFLWFGQGDAQTAPLARVQQAREVVPNIVTDAERADAAAGVLQEIQRSHEAYVKRLAELQTVFLNVDRNYEVTAGDYEPIVTEVEALQLEHQKELLELRVGLKGHLTREEWQRVFRKEK